MYGIRFHRYRGGDNALHIQITLRGRRRSDTDGLIRQKRVKRIPLGFRINGYRFYSYGDAMLVFPQADALA